MFASTTTTALKKRYYGERLKTRRKSAEQARNQFPDLLKAAEKGQSTIITKHGRPVAALVPVEAYAAAVRQQPLTPLAGSGRGLWGKNSIRTVRKWRGEWSA
jgi:prevent-host-death family protein